MGSKMSSRSRHTPVRLSPQCGKLLTYQRPCCVGTVQVDDSAEVVVECDVDVQATNDAILISKAFTL
jgi:hypothetical protein